MSGKERQKSRETALAGLHVMLRDQPEVTLLYVLACPNP